MGAEAKSIESGDGREGDLGEAFEQIFMIIAGVLLLPRQWIAAGLALSIAVIIAVVRRARAGGPSSSTHS